MQVTKRWLGLLVRDLEEQGCRTRVGKGQKTVVYPPNGGMFTIHLTPSDRAFYRTIRTSIRTHGLEWPPDYDRM